MHDLTPASRAREHRESERDEVLQAIRLRDRVVGEYALRLDIEPSCGDGASAADRRQVCIRRVTAALAIATLFVTQIPLGQLQGLQRGRTRKLFIGLGCLVLAARMYFFYVNRTHLARRKMVRLPNPEARDEKQPDPEMILGEVEEVRGWALRVGNAAFAAGLILLALALVLYVLIAQR